MLQFVLRMIRLPVRAVPMLSVVEYVMFWPLAIVGEFTVSHGLSDSTVAEHDAPADRVGTVCTLPKNGVLDELTLNPV